MLQLPEIKQGNSPDVFEIDAASNRGIDDIRELRENVRYSPAASRYKIYIIDEVHRLTHEAFDALLKTLEEPPPHVIFIFATTEPQALPPRFCLGPSDSISGGTGKRAGRGYKQCRSSRGNSN
jgi:DNA polymerase III gamma/tau subunit